MLSESSRVVLSLFETVPHVMICVKGRDGTYLAVNEAFVQRTNRRHVVDVVGRRAADLFPADLAASYEAQDRSLLLTGRSVRNQLEIITDGSGRPGWYLSTKVLGGTAESPEVVAVSVEAQLTRSTVPGGGRVWAAVELARRDVSAGLTVGDLAAEAGMSTDRLERAMHRVLGVSPKQYLLRNRIEQAATLLASTDTPISAIAASCGFFDQSQLNRQFKTRVGVTPGRYRALARAGDAELR